jgi:glycerophosphoryl diester phosphodiesterase
MQILAHRGFWKAPEEKNSRTALERAFAEGFGVETDIRDQNGPLVISHDPPSGDCITFQEFLSLYQRHNRPGPMALNVKADGLQNLVGAELAQAGLPSDTYFFFDMSIPDAVGYARQNLPIYTRESEFEPTPHLLDMAQGIVLDCFQSDWITPAKILHHLQAGRSMMLISPELHGRDPAQAWAAWRELTEAGVERTDGVQLHLCTDRPLEAREIFGGADNRGGAV